MTRYNRGWMVDPETGMLIDPETGVVIDDSPLDLQPEFRAYDAEEFIQRDHYTPIEKPREPTKRERLESLVEKRGLPEDGEELKTIREEIGGYMLLGESQAIDLCGIRCLAAFRVLRWVLNTPPSTALDALRAAVYGDETGAPRKAVTLAKRVVRLMDEAVDGALARWIAYPVGTSIDVYRVAIVFAAPVRRGVVRQVIVEAAGLKVQITRSKVDVSARLSERERVIRALSVVTRKLGVELTEPRPATVTLVLNLPYRVDVASLQALERRRDSRVRVVLQGARRAKVTAARYTAIVYPRTVNIYTREHRRERLYTILLDIVTLTAQHAHT